MQTRAEQYSTETPRDDMEGRITPFPIGATPKAMALCEQNRIKSDDSRLSFFGCRRRQARLKICASSAALTKWVGA
jgi:hypothetical protein